MNLETVNRRMSEWVGDRNFAVSPSAFVADFG